MIHLCVFFFGIVWLVGCLSVDFWTQLPKQILQFEISSLMNLIFQCISNLNTVQTRKKTRRITECFIREIREKFFWESWHLAVSCHYFLRLTFIQSLIILSESCLMNSCNLLKHSCQILPNFTPSTLKWTILDILHIALCPHDQEWRPIYLFLFK